MNTAGLTNARAIIVSFAMVLAAVLAWVMQPTAKVSNLSPKVDLETTIPNSFGDWNIDVAIAQVLPSPEVQETLNRIYSQVLSRTYVNSKGQRIMLSIAYGDGFDKQLDIHRPEYCYPAQGFEVGNFADQVVNSSLGEIPVRRLVARQGKRTEPISYWITIGETTLSSTWERRVLKIWHRWSGKIDSGMLVRVSSIDSDESGAFAIQENFIRTLVGSIPAENRKLIINLAASLEQ